MKIILTLALICFIHLPLLSQRILLEKDISQAYKNIKGPNTKSFGQFYIGNGFIIAESSNPDVQIKNFYSRFASFGYRKKYKLFASYSAGFETEFLYRQFNIRQTEEKLVPNTVIHDKEKLKLYSGSLTLYNRINFGKRGNIIGKFLDIGGYMSYNFKTVHYTKDKLSDSVIPSETDVHAKTRISKNIKLDYIQPFEYGVYGRAGINWFAIKASYRLSNLFKDKYNWAELPGFYAGIEFSFPTK